jgi:hypothetical protein
MLLWARDKLSEFGKIGRRLGRRLAGPVPQLDLETAAQASQIERKVNFHEARVARQTEEGILLSKWLRSIAVLFLHLQRYWAAH